MSMNIGIIGIGDVAKALGEGLAAIGHNVMIGTRSPERKDIKAWLKHGDFTANKQVGSTTEAAVHGTVIVLATPWQATEDVLAQIRPHMSGKTLIDVTNPVEFEDDGEPRLSVGHEISGGELVQSQLPDSHVIKTLNYVNFAHMVQPEYDSGEPTMFLCGNNTGAKKQTADILNDLGWNDIVDLGQIDKCRLLEPLCVLWIEYGASRGTWDHAISFLQK